MDIARRLLAAGCLVFPHDVVVKRPPDELVRVGLASDAPTIRRPRGRRLLVTE